MALVGLRRPSFFDSVVSASRVHMRLGQHVRPTYLVFRRVVPCASHADVWYPRGVQAYRTPARRPLNGLRAARQEKGAYSYGCLQWRIRKAHVVC